MKARIVKCIIVCVSVIGLLLLWLSGRNVKFLDDVNMSDIYKIEMCLSGYITVTEKEDIEHVVKVIQTMEFDNAFLDIAPAGGFDVRIFFKDGTENSFIFFEDDVNIDGDTYNCDSRYGDELRAMFFELCEKYPAQD